MRGRESIAWLTPLWLGACAVGTPCERGDWYAMGVADGRNGATETAITRRADQCPVNLDDDAAAAWEAGRIAGLDDYCQPRTAFDAGLDGYDFETHCPDRYGHLEDAYALGVEQRELRAEVARLNAAVAVLDGRRQKALSKLDDVRARLGQARAEGGDDAAAALAIAELERRLPELDREIAGLRSAQDSAADSLRDHRHGASVRLATLD